MRYVDCIEYERHLEAMGAQLDEDAFDSAWAEGSHDEHGVSC